MEGVTCWLFCVAKRSGLGRPAAGFVPAWAGGKTSRSDHRRWPSRIVGRDSDRLSHKMRNILEKVRGENGCPGHLPSRERPGRKLPLPLSVRVGATPTPAWYGSWNATCRSCSRSLLSSASVAQIAHRQRGRASHRGGAPPDAAYVVCFVNVECADRIIYSIFQRFNLGWKTRSPSAYLHRRQCDSAPPSFAIFSSRLDLHTCCSLELLPGNWLVLGLDRPSL